MLIAQLTDLHIKSERRKAYGVVDTSAMLEVAVAHLLRVHSEVDCVLLTGDLVDHGTADDYSLLRELLGPLLDRFGSDVYLIPGNHDERAALAQAFPEHTHLAKNQEHLHYTVSLAPNDGLRLVALDTVVPGQSHGELCDERLHWIEECLCEHHAPTLIAMHHPPFASGIAHMDKISLRNPERFEAIVKRHSHIKRIVCGHLHRSVHTVFGGVLASSCPSTAHQVALDLDADSRDDFVLEPPGYQLHSWDGRRFVSNAVVVGEFGARYPFRDGGALID
jgi:3',5'-cyclic-AMP phosphodiesterase